VGTKVGLDAAVKRKISCPCREWNPYSSAVRAIVWSLYRLRKNKKNKLNLRKGKKISQEIIEEGKEKGQVKEDYTDKKK
jgi:hypothetical protein